MMKVGSSKMSKGFSKNERRSFSNHKSHVYLQQTIGLVRLNLSFVIGEKSMSLFVLYNLCGERCLRDDAVANKGIAFHRGYAVAHGT